MASSWMFNHFQTKIHPSCCPNSLPLKTMLFALKFSIYVTSTCYGFPSKSYPAISIRNPPWAGLGTRPGNPACDDKKPRRMSWRFPSKYDKYDSQLQIGIKKKKLTVTTIPTSSCHQALTHAGHRIRNLICKVTAGLRFPGRSVHAPLRGHHRSSQVDVTVPHCPFRKCRFFSYMHAFWMSPHTWFSPIWVMPRAKLAIWHFLKKLSPGSIAKLTNDWKVIFFSM